MKNPAFVYILVMILTVAFPATGYGQRHIKQPGYVVTQEDLTRIASVPRWNAPDEDLTLPQSVDNTLTKYFPPVITQKGNSCSQASGIGYVFTYETNLMLDRDSSLPENRFSYHFIWNFLNDGADRGSMPMLGYDLAAYGGVPDMTDMDDDSERVNSLSWMSGYDKYVRAMSYRVKEYFLIDLKSPEGISRMKRYLYDRGENLTAGGIATISCYTDDWKLAFYDGPSLTGIMQVITRGGTEGPHSITIVGYDDTVGFDLNGDGMVGEGEYGAFIIVNTWGPGWGSDGKTYYPYKLFLTPYGEGGLRPSEAEALTVTPEYHEPGLIFRIRLKYTSRNDISFVLGAADGRGAEQSTVSLVPPVISNQGGDHYMRGGGSEDDKTIEVALDFTDKADEVDSYSYPNFFLTVRKTAKGKTGDGVVENFSVLDLRNGKEYHGSRSGVPVQGITVLSTAPPLSYSPYTWLRGGYMPSPGTFIIKSPGGETVKMKVTGYESESRKVTLKYKPIP